MKNWDAFSEKCPLKDAHTGRNVFFSQGTRYLIFLKKMTCVVPLPTEKTQLKLGAGSHWVFAQSNFTNLILRTLFPLLHRVGQVP